MNGAPHPYEHSRTPTLTVELAKGRSGRGDRRQEGGDRRPRFDDRRGGYGDRRPRYDDRPVSCSGVLHDAEGGVLTR